MCLCQANIPPWIILTKLKNVIFSGKKNLTRTGYSEDRSFSVRNKTKIMVGS